MFHLAAQGMGAAGANVERCSACGARAPLDDRGHCRKCVPAVTRAAALDSFDPGVGLCLEAGIDEIQLRHALILTVN
jgi:ribosomal protein L40E